MNNGNDPEEELYEAKEDLRMERAYRNGWIIAFLVCGPAGMYLIPVADAAGGNMGKAYGLICCMLFLAAMTSAVAFMIQTFSGIPHARRKVDRSQREYDKFIVAEAGL